MYSISKCWLPQPLGFYFFLDCIHVPSTSAIYMAYVKTNKPTFKRLRVTYPHSLHLTKTFWYEVSTLG
jgi:hypothetical protein